MSEKIIEVNHLAKKFGAFDALKDVSFTVNKGDVFGFLGPNGAGKSTTIKILTGIIGDFEGSATVLNMDVRKNPIEIKQKIV